MQNCIIAVANTNTKLNSYLSNGNFCSIRREQFWLPQLPVILEQALSYKIIGQCYFCNISQQIWNYYLPPISWVLLTSVVTNLSYFDYLNYQ